MICQPCGEAHQAGDRIDTKADRQYPWRHCVGQRHPRQGPRGDLSDHADSSDQLDQDGARP